MKKNLRQEEGENEAELPGQERPQEAVAGD